MSRFSRSAADSSARSSPRWWWPGTSRPSSLAQAARTNSRSDRRLRLPAESADPPVRQPAHASLDIRESGERPPLGLVAGPGPGSRRSARRRRPPGCSATIFAARRPHRASRLPRTTRSPRAVSHRNGRRVIRWSTMLGAVAESRVEVRQLALEVQPLSRLAAAGSAPSAVSRATFCSFPPPPPIPPRRWQADAGGLVVKGPESIPARSGSVSPAPRPSRTARDPRRGPLRGLSSSCPGRRRVRWGRRPPGSRPR